MIPSFFHGNIGEHRGTNPHCSDLSWYHSVGVDALFAWVKFITTTDKIGCQISVSNPPNPITNLPQNKHDFWLIPFASQDKPILYVNISTYVHIIYTCTLTYLSCVYLYIYIYIYLYIYIYIHNIIHIYMCTKVDSNMSWANTIFWCVSPNFHWRHALFWKSCDQHPCPLWACLTVYWEIAGPERFLPSPVMTL